MLRDEVDLHADVVHVSPESRVDVSTDIENEQTVRVDLYDRVASADAELEDHATFQGKLVDPWREVVEHDHVTDRRNRLDRCRGALPLQVILVFLPGMIERVHQCPARAD